MWMNPSTVAATVKPPVAFACRSCGPSFGASVGRIVARIHGALGSTLLVGLDRVVVCRCDSTAADVGNRLPWSYADLDGVDLQDYGSLPVAMFHVTGRIEPLPVLVLERAQIAAALDGLVTLRRLIAQASTRSTYLSSGVAS
jgi:hypothetical protein